MKAKKLKEIISKIPDDDNVIFTYSMFDFSRVNPYVFHGEEIVQYFSDESDDFSKEQYPHSEHDWMIEFDN